METYLINHDTYCCTIIYYNSNFPFSKVNHLFQTAWIISLNNYSNCFQLENSESFPQRTHENTHTSCSTKGVNVDTSRMQVIKITKDHLVKFSSGILTHPFDMRSVYTHANAKGEMEATTHQDKWITVDYIFYSNIQAVEKYTLPTVNQCAMLPTIPNFVVGSDHLSIGATFRLPRKKSLL